MQKRRTFWFWRIQTGILLPCSTAGFCHWRWEKQRNEALLPPLVETLALNVCVMLSIILMIRHDVQRSFRDWFNVLYQEHQKTSSLCANPSQISSDIVLWKERCLGRADGSDSPRRALNVCLSRKKRDFTFFKILRTFCSSGKSSSSRTYMFCKSGSHI